LLKYYLNVRYPDGRRGAFCNKIAVNGDAVLLRVRPSLPDEKGVASALEGPTNVTWRNGEAPRTASEVPTGCQSVGGETNVIYEQL